MRRPPYLKKGDKIALVAPARKITEQELSPAVQLLQDWGLEPVIGKHCLGEFNQFSGNDAQRTSDFQTALDDSSIKAIIAARGGYGCIRIIDQLDFSNFNKHPKWIIGYSDMTVFHSFLHQKTNVSSIHATMPINFMKNVAATESLRKLLYGESIRYDFSSQNAIRIKNTEGVLVGGNLSLLYAQLGSDSDLKTDEKILFIEDLDEYLYHIDRMMIALKRAGKLSRLKALLVGGFTDMKDNPVPFGKNAESIITDAVKDFDYPVYFNFPAGHQDMNNAIMLGEKATIEVAGTELIFRQ